MVTVLRADGQRVVIYLNDHQPAHVHVLSDGEAKISLSDIDGAVELVWAEAMTRGDMRRAMRLVAEHQDFLLQRWKDIHGRDD